ncbi:hypothetical protein BH20ACI3_BH20ACI3_02680 [soil metagenome]
MFWLTLSLVLFFVGIVLVIWTWWHRSDPNPSSEGSGGWLNSNIKFNLPAKLISSVLQTPGLQTKIVFNGHEFSSLNDMPRDIRKAYDEVMGGMLVDANRNNIPDIIEGGGGSSVFTGIRTLTPDDPAEKLKKLKEMRDTGLITAEEYETKRSEILSRM